MAGRDLSRYRIMASYVLTKDIVYRKGGGVEGVGRGASFIHFLYKVLGKRSVQKEPF